MIGTLFCLLHPEVGRTGSAWYSGSKMSPMFQVPSFLLHQLYFMISIHEAVFSLQDSYCSSKPYV